MSSKLLFKKFLQASDIMKECQKTVIEDFKNYSFYTELTLNYYDTNFISLFKKNFFTILMLSLINESNIPKSRVISYGKIIMFLRQIVTSIDNILDDEKKGNIFINSLNNPLVENSFISLITQELLTKEILKLNCNNKKINTILLEEIYSIAKGESIRKREIYNKYPSSNFILENVHKQIGGKLLEISLTIPKIIENNLKISEFSDGLFIIGMSLQALDDFFDMEEDFQNNNINLAIAKYSEIFKVTESQIDFKSIDPYFTANYLTHTINTAYSGFSKLQNAGFPINLKEVKFILKKLFILRGLENYIHYIV
ncbi:Uncharacterised protein [Fusobacterium necrogenes]|uniref:Uncharacterized protein n=1 Tax=Fusobacterium necrogenes TaxID=858 RepID=A0A377GVR2_9FUSO|nr:hypothetical protein [Fusobacterium necrogenes]STO31036.1 Uncharacterised protein [Fusobacterium necrogenes]